MNQQPLPALAEFTDLGHVATTEVVIPVGPVHLTARHAAILLVADYGRAVVLEMSPHERARALQQCVERRTLIDTTQTDIATVRTLLVNDMGAGTTTPSSSYQGATQLDDDDIPSVFTDTDDDFETMETVT